MSPRSDSPYHRAVTKEECLAEIKGKIENMAVRRFIKAVIKNYDPFETYIIYDNNKIEIFDHSIWELRKNTKTAKRWLIVRPLEVI